MPRAAQVLDWESAYWRAAESPESTMTASRRTGLAKRPARDSTALTRWAISSRWRVARALPSMSVAGILGIIARQRNSEAARQGDSEAARQGDSETARQGRNSFALARYHAADVRQEPQGTRSRAARAVGARESGVLRGGEPDHVGYRVRCAAGGAFGAGEGAPGAG